MAKAAEVKDRCSKNVGDIKSYSCQQNESAPITTYTVRSCCCWKGLGFGFGLILIYQHIIIRYPNKTVAI